MDFNPNDATESKPKLLPEGEYDLDVREAEERISSKGNPMIALELVPAGDDKPVIKEFLVATPTAMFKIEQFCNAAGLADKYQTGRLTEADCRDVRVRAKVVIEDGGDFADKNRVAEFVGPPHEPKETAAAGKYAHPDTPDDTDIPF